MAEGGPRVALVGMGPRGLFALERLVHHAAATATALDVDAYEPHPAAGAGPHYDPAQPSFLRMNLPSGAVDMWPAGTGAGPSFVEWAAASGAPVDRDGHAARSLVGRYLSDGLARVLDAAGRAGVAVRVRDERVRGIERGGPFWAVHAGAGGAARPDAYDEVLLCTGHAPARPGRGMDPAAARVARGVYPVGRCLGEGEVPAGARVAVRGMALTFMDA
ncbi:MAG: FAD/NAD(P)-binding protein, partial [Miltoncostaeaceae bacterium]